MNKLICILFFLLPNSTVSDDKTKLLEKLVSQSSKFESIAPVMDIIKKNEIVFTSIPSINPINPKNVNRYSSGFGNRFHPIDKEYKSHFGLDISANLATPVHASASGVISEANQNAAGYGKLIKIKHAYGFETRFGHLSAIYVKAGLKVNKGDIIGFIGSTGKSTGNHLHYEVRKNGNPIDPKPFLNL